VLDLSWRRLPVEVTDAEIRRVGPESAARAARYAALEGEADRIGASAIALAHHRDDQAETVLMRALVGAGTRGLAAMRPRSGRRIRPLLGVARTELADHAAGRGLRWTEDPSNRDPRYLRNALRHRLLPAAVEVVGPSAAAQLARLAERAATDEELLESLARDLADGARDGDGLAVGTLCKAHPALQLRALGDLARSVAPDVRLGAAHLEAARRLLEGPDRDAGIDLPGEARLERRGRRLVARRIALPQGEDPGDVGLNERGTTPWPAVGLTLHARLHGALEQVGRGPGAGITRAWFDREQLTSSPRVHKLAAGTRMKPFGAPGSRKVSDVLADAGIARELRRSWPVVSVDGTVIWVPGARAADVARVGEGTVQILDLSMGEYP
jgi:tRNA(Ile)-lysidine synthase